MHKVGKLRKKALEKYTLAKYNDTVVSLRHTFDTVWCAWLLHGGIVSGEMVPHRVCI